MEAKAKLFGHAVHPMLIVFPLGLLATSVIFDVIGLVREDSVWSGMSFYLIAAGVLSGLFAALFGAIDWLAIPRGTRASAVGLSHGLSMVVAVLLFAGSWLVRRGDPSFPSDLAIGLSIAGFLVAGVGGWLGGELVERLGVGVSPGANLDAPSSLSRSARATLGTERLGR
jgi:uncharacterized membrane protein